MIFLSSMKLSYFDSLDTIPNPSFNRLHGSSFPTQLSDIGAAQASISGPLLV